MAEYYWAVVFSIPFVPTAPLSLRFRRSVNSTLHADVFWINQNCLITKGHVSFELVAAASFQLCAARRRIVSRSDFLPRDHQVLFGLSLDLAYYWQVPTTSPNSKALLYLLQNLYFYVGAPQSLSLRRLFVCKKQMKTKHLRYQKYLFTRLTRVAIGHYSIY